MTPTEQRDQVCEMAKHDSVQALTKARDIADPWFRAQALSWVARFSASETSVIASEAAASAMSCNDAFKRVAVRAWEIAALAERDCLDRSRISLTEVLTDSATVTPVASRAAALTLILDAATRIGNEEAIAVAELLISSCGNDAHWRAQRALVEAAALQWKICPEAGASFTSRIANPVTKKKAEKAISGGGRSSRRFFW